MNHLTWPFSSPRTPWRNHQNTQNQDVSTFTIAYWCSRVNWENAPISTLESSNAYSFFILWNVHEMFFKFKVSPIFWRNPTPAVQPHLHVTWFLPSCNDPGHRPNLRLNGRIGECFSWRNGGPNGWPNNFEPLPSYPRIIQGPRSPKIRQKWDMIFQKYDIEWNTCGSKHEKSEMSPQKFNMTARIIFTMTYCLSCVWMPRRSVRWHAGWK